MPTFWIEGPEKTHSTNVVIAAHAKRENHYAILVLYLKVSQVFNSQDKHNTSSFFHDVLTQIAPSHRKYNKILMKCNAFWDFFICKEK